MLFAHRRMTFGLTAAAVLFACSSFGQTEQQPPPTGGGGAPGGAGGNVPSPGNVPGGTPSPGRTPTQPQMDPRERNPFPEQQRPIFLSGKVIMQDGTPPPEPVLIERVCGSGGPRPEGYTDSKGRFSFQLGQNSAVLADASVSSMGDIGGTGRSGGQSLGGFGNQGGFSERDLMGCELRASLPGHRSEIINLSGRRMMDNPDVGTIVLRRLANVEGVTTSALNLLAPKDAKKAFERGHNNIRKGKWVDAQKDLEKAVELYPKYAGAWFELGLAHEQQNRIEDARKAYAQALAADGKFVQPYLQVAGLLAREGKWQEVADTTDQMLKLNPVDYPRAYFFNSVANLNLKKLDEAEKSARDGVKIDEFHRFPKLAHVLGVILAQKQDFVGAAEHMKSYLKFAPNATDVDFVKKQLAEVESLATNRGTAQEPPR